MPKSPENPSASARVTRRAALGSAAAAAAVRVVPARAAATTARHPATPHAQLISAWPCVSSSNSEVVPQLIAPDPDGSVWTVGNPLVVRHSVGSTLLGEWSHDRDDGHPAYASALMVGRDGTLRLSIGREFPILHYSHTGDVVGWCRPRLPQSVPALPLDPATAPALPYSRPSVACVVLSPRDALSPAPSDEFVPVARLDQCGDLDTVAALRLPSTIRPVWDRHNRVIAWTIPDFDFYGTVLAPDGSYWFHGGSGQIGHMASDGELLAYWWAQQNDWRLADLALSLDGSVWTLHPEYRQVRRFSPAGDLLASWGTYGDAPGQLDDPVSLAVAADGTVLVADHGNRRVHRFAPDGVFLGCLGDGDVAAARLVRPVAVRVAPDGTVVVIDHEPARILRFALA